MKNLNSRPILPCLFIFYMFSTQALKSQDITPTLSQRNAYKLRVKQIDEFFDRFNSDSLLLQGYKNDAFSNRELNILLLFRQDSLLSLRNNASGLLKQFLKKTTEYPLHFYSPDWFAIANSNYTYKEKTIRLNLTLHNHIYPREKSSWMIAGVSENILNYGLATNDSTLVKLEKDFIHHYIPPNAHESNFIELKRAIKPSKDLHNYFDNPTYSETLQVYYNLVQMGELKHNYVNTIEFYFLQYYPFVFKVAFYPEKSENSGWRIKELFKSSLTKDKFLENVLKIH